MKLKNLNIGSALSRAELKQIKGGELFCTAGKFVPDCKCANGITYCIPADGNTPYHACTNYCLSVHGDGAASAVGCTTTCNVE